MSYRDYLRRLFGQRPTGQRPGQWAFNILYSERPDLAELVRGSGVDPFHHDELLSEFLAFVKASL